MSRTLQFTVAGVAQPKGSTRAFARMVRGRDGKNKPVASVTSDNPQLKGWESLVRESARAAQRKAVLAPFEGAVRVDAVFYLPRPKSLPKAVVYHTRKPDVDKLLRGAIDGLIGVVFADDNQVVVAKCRKAYACDGRPPGAEFTIDEVF